MTAGPGEDAGAAERLRGLLVLAQVVLLPLVFWPFSRDAFHLVKGAALAALALPALACWLGEGRPGLDAVPRWLRWVVAAFLAWTLLRAVGAGDRGAALLRCGAWLLSFAGAAAALGLPARFRERIPAALAASTALVAAIGITEVALGRRVFATDPRFLTFTPDRAASTLGNPIVLAGFLSLGLPWIFLEMLAVPGGRRRILPGAAFGLGCLALLLTGSRGGLLGIALAAVFLWFAAPERRRALSVMAAGFALALAAQAFARPASWLHLLEARDPGRVFIWRTAARMWRAAPFLGAGTGQFAFRYPCERDALGLPQDVGFRGNAVYAHNEPMQELAEGGIPGLALLLAVLAGLFLLPARGSPGTAVRAGLVALAPAALFCFPLQVMPLQALVLLLPAAAAVREEGRVRPHRALLAAAAAGAVLLAAPGMRPLERSAHFGEAVRASAAERFAEAGPGFTRALRLLPDTAQERVTFHLGEMRYASGELGEAQVAFERDAAAFPCVPDAHGYLAYIQLLRAVHGQPGTVAEAERQVTAALALRPPPDKAARLLNLKGSIRAFAGDARGAEVNYRASLAIDPGLVLAAENLARVLRRSGRRREAERILYDARRRAGATSAP